VFPNILIFHKKQVSIAMTNGYALSHMLETILFVSELRIEKKTVNYLNNCN